MSKAPKKKPIGARANRTRAEILTAAEQLFAIRGFSATRLEDVGEEVGLTRAALFYHFKDKQMLYDAMIANAFGPLDKRLHDLLDATDRTIPERIELAVEAWLDAIIAQPTLAKLIMRFVVDDSAQAAQKIYTDDQLLPLKFFALFEEGCRTGAIKPFHSDPFHIASAVIGTTVFYVSALSTLIPQGLSAPLSQEQLQNHKQEALRSAQRLIGIA